MKTDFTKNLYIIFIIFENFWEAFQVTLFFGLFWSFRCFPRYRNSIQIFFHFSLSFLRREFHQLDSSLNAVILSILHLMLMRKIQPRSNHHAFLSYPNAKLAFIPWTRIFLRVQFFGLDAAFYIAWDAAHFPPMKRRFH